MLEDYGCVGITTSTVACALHDTTWTTMTSVSVTSRDDGPSRSTGPKRRGDSATPPTRHEADRESDHNGD